MLLGVSASLGQSIKTWGVVTFYFFLSYRLVTLCFPGCNRKLLVLRPPGSLFLTSLPLSSCIKMKGRANAFTVHVEQLWVKPLAFSQLTVLVVFEGADFSLCPLPQTFPNNSYIKENGRHSVKHTWILYVCPTVA